MKNDMKILWLTYDISNKTLIGPKPLRVRFDKIDGFIRVYDGSRYLVLLGPEKYVAIYNRIRYLVSLKSSITCIFSHYFQKSKLILKFFAYRKNVGNA